MNMGIINNTETMNTAIQTLILFLKILNPSTIIPGSASGNMLKKPSHAFVA